MTVPLWTGALALLGALLIGAAAGVALGGGSDSGATPNQTKSGVVDSVDSDGNGVCVNRAGRVECYRAPGRGVNVGVRVRFRTEQQPVDPEDPGKGTEPVLVYVAVD